MLTSVLKSMLRIGEETEEKKEEVVAKGEEEVVITDTTSVTNELKSLLGIPVSAAENAEPDLLDTEDSSVAFIQQLVQTTKKHQEIAKDQPWDPVTEVKNKYYMLKFQKSDESGDDLMSND